METVNIHCSLAEFCKFKCSLLLFRCFLGLIDGLLYFKIHDPTIHNPKMQDSCKNYVFLSMPWTDWRERKQFTLHRKLHWIIPSLDSFLLKQKADKITCIFLKSMHISPLELSCLFRELIYAMCSHILPILLLHVAKSTHVTSGLI